MNPLKDIFYWDRERLLFSTSPQATQQQIPFGEEKSAQKDAKEGIEDDN
jgi:hypothetical protein